MKAHCSRYSCGARDAPGLPVLAIVRAYVTTPQQRARVQEATYVLIEKWCPEALLFCILV